MGPMRRPQKVGRLFPGLWIDELGLPLELDSKRRDVVLDAAKELFGESWSLGFDYERRFVDMRTRGEQHDRH
jgi:hypothetical protein